MCGLGSGYIEGRMSAQVRDESCFGLIANGNVKQRQQDII